jgi:hypothetical protein
MGARLLFLVVIGVREPAYYKGSSHADWDEKTTPDGSN